MEVGCESRPAEALSGNPEYSVDIDAFSDASWDALVSQFSDANIYQTSAYGRVRWGTRQLSRLVVRRDGEAVGAAQLRVVNLPWFRGGVAYLRWGPMCRRSDRLPGAEVSAVVDALEDEYVSRRGLCLFILPHAFSGTAEATALEQSLEEAGFTRDRALPPYNTIVVDLSPPISAIRQQLDQKWRNQLNGAEKRGCNVELDFSDEAFADFEALYREMIARKRFETSVHVSDFAKVQQHLPTQHKMQILRARRDSITVGALVISQFGDNAVYLLGATNDEGRRLKAAYLLHWQAMMWLKAKGVRWYDLGGVDALRNSGGFHFKSGFGGVPLQHISGRVCAATPLSRLLQRCIHLGRRLS